MDYPIQVPVTDFAQLALDVYDDPDANDVRPGFNKAWAKLNTWTSPNQFHATFYKNMQTNVGVLSIRGTVPGILKTLGEDGLYVLGEFTAKDMSQYHDTIRFYNFLQNFNPWKETKEKYVCGHSLGGMLAKAIAHTTGLNTIAFNSPGMNRYLAKLGLPFSLKFPNVQKQITYVSTNDLLVGNQMNLYDNGKFVYIEPSKEENTVVNNSTPLHFHKMKLLYTTIKNGINRNDYF